MRASSLFPPEPLELIQAALLVPCGLGFAAAESCFGRRLYGTLRRTAIANYERTRSRVVLQSARCFRTPRERHRCVRIFSRSRRRRSRGYPRRNSWPQHPAWVVTTTNQDVGTVNALFFKDLAIQSELPRRIKIQSRPSESLLHGHAPTRFGSED